MHIRRPDSIIKSNQIQLTLELKCAHQKAGLGSRGEEAMARALQRNPNILKIGYAFRLFNYHLV